MAGLNAKVGWKVVGNGSSGGITSINQLHKDGLRVGKRMHVVLLEEGWVQEAGRGARINQRADKYRWVVGTEEMDEKG